MSEARVSPRSPTTWVRRLTSLLRRSSGPRRPSGRCHFMNRLIRLLPDHCAVQFLAQRLGQGTWIVRRQSSRLPKGTPPGGGGGVAPGTINGQQTIDPSAEGNAASRLQRGNAGLQALPWRPPGRPPFRNRIMRLLTLDDRALVFGVDAYGYYRRLGDHPIAGADLDASATSWWRSLRESDDPSPDGSWWHPAGRTARCASRQRLHPWKGRWQEPSTGRR